MTRATLVCVMGVSAVGKTTVGTALASALAVPFVDADDLHPAANRAKMTAGIPLDDADRRPWLDTVGARLRAAERTGLVIACSALRRVYRDRIRAVEPGVRFVHLSGSPVLLAERARERTGHFMPPALLQSQLATLEPLGDDEVGVVVDVAMPVEELVAQVAERLGQPLR
ncbi:gluconokinase [Microbacterium sp. Sa4CUA7]|uniref:Gluconokinase n=1 Tax=Microbacterium pullorum TaxID=2762236 RepID=A0ABR8S076_9MICO|nr:gluconokinase [Microbacterium pullorum]MBD7956901.1 gluconokinase [Microbacterium pullorum]